MSLFQVVSSRRRDLDTGTPFVLYRDNWNDFGFMTMYQLQYTTPEEKILLGSVRILKLGQSRSDPSTLELGPLEALDRQYCSVGADLDYYERIARLPDDIKQKLLFAIRDVIAGPSIAREFEKEEGWSVSLFRDVNEEDFRRLASVLLTQDYDSLLEPWVTLSFQPNGWDNPLTLTFDAPPEDPFFPRVSGGEINRLRLPRRIVVLTGRNGSGKSTILSRLARVLHASQKDRISTTISNLGVVTPAGIGFSRIITISYSAFDAFQVPGLSRSERKQIAKDIEAGEGRFIFCGLRDIGKELIQIVNSTEEDEPDDTSPFEVDLDRENRTFLKSLERLAEEFHRTIVILRQRGRMPLLYKVLDILLQEASFADFDELAFSYLEGDAREAFLQRSTGHKIVLLTMASLVAYTEPKSMVLVDEPETHLHPPLLAAYMHAMRYVLEERDAFAVVATHSPVVAQETLGRHVKIVRRDGDTTIVVDPTIETFGESIGGLTDEIFGLTSNATDFHEILKGLVQRHQSIEHIEKFFKRGLSLQARAYVMTLIDRAKSVG